MAKTRIGQFMIEPALYRRLVKKAREVGLSVSAYVRVLVVRDLEARCRTCGRIAMEERDGT